MERLVIGAILGVILGSFVECISRRSLGKVSFWGRSYCDSCKKKLAWYDLLPVLSFLILRGRCHYCHKKISTQSLLVELTMGLLVAVFFYKGLPSNFLSFSLDNLITIWPDVLFKLFFICVLAILFLTDLRVGLIPDRVSIPAIKITAVYLVVWTLLQIGYLNFSLRQSLLGNLLLSKSDYFTRHAFYTTQPLIGSLASALLAAAFFGSLILITRGRGMGGGDLKLGVLIGLALGFPLTILALLLSFVFGSVVGIGLIIFGKKSFGQTIPFGPFLSLGSIVALISGTEIINWYFKFKLL